VDVGVTYILKDDILGCMPLLSEDDIKALIAENAIGAISVDTSVFDKYQCDLESQALLGLGQFKGTAIHLVLSEIIAGEVKSHIAREAAESQAKLKSALGQIRKRWRIVVDHAAVDAVLGIRQTSAAYAAEAFAIFIGVVKPEIVQVDGLVTHAEVLRRYFAAEAPFSTSEIKKNEFPDALALLSLEAWAEQNNTTMLTVSRDKDWHTFAEASDRLICVSDLGVALDYFNQEARFIVTRAVGLLRQDAAADLFNEIERSIEQFLETFDPEIEAYALLDYEVDHLDTSLQHWEVDTGSDPKVLNADGDTVVFALSIKATVNFSATFRYSVYDGVDRDMVYLGSDTKDVEQTITIPIVISIDREIDPEPLVQRIDITPPRVVIDFGSIDPKGGSEE
jgi:hypothetical protein